MPAGDAVGVAGSHSVGARVGANGQHVPADDTKTVLNVMSVVESDVDGDGDRDYVADLSCGEGPESPGRQVVAFRLSGSELTPIAVVVERDVGDVHMISEIADRGNGRIGVLVSNAYSDGGYRFVPSQWRVYRLESGRFGQVGGPASFPADPPGIKVTMDSSIRLDFHPTADGLYVGELIFMVRNEGELDAGNLQLRLFLPPRIRPAGDGWTGCTTSTFSNTTGVDCDLPSLAAGMSRQLRFTLIAETMAVDTKGDGFGTLPYLDIEQLPPYQYEKALPDTVQIALSW